MRKPEAWLGSLTDPTAGLVSFPGAEASKQADPHSRGTWNREHGQVRSRNTRRRRCRSTGIVDRRDGRRPWATGAAGGGLTLPEEPRAQS